MNSQSNNVDGQISFLFQQDNTKSNNDNTDGVICLFNGENAFHTFKDMKINKKQYETTMNVQQNAYRKYIGRTVGDFNVLDIVYDWGTHKQVWKVKCELCGEIFEKANGYQWSRGKDYSRQCHCRKEKKAREKMEHERLMQQKKEDYQKELQNEIGKQYGTYSVIECNGFGDGKCKVLCNKCGQARRAGIYKLRNGEYPKCHCKVDNVNYYDDKKWIGMRFGHLTTVQRNGQYFLCKCDCGAERYVQPYHLFVLKRYVNCGRADCKYISENKQRAISAREQGKSYEAIVNALVKNSGYKTKLVAKTGDYGIDIIAMDIATGMKIGIQCKCNTRGNIGVKAIQEVYAGGRYYNLEHFAVVSYKGFSKQAIKMAKKLGVYLSDGMSFVYPENMDQYINDLIPTYNATKNTKAQKLYEMNGEKKTLANWAFEYGSNEEYVRKGLAKGLSLENALKYTPFKKRKYYTYKDFTGTVAEICRHFSVGVTSQTIINRINKGMSIDEAINYEPHIGRPTKQMVSKPGQLEMAI